MADTIVTSKVDLAAMATEGLDTLRARARGAFLGLAVGDALGATVEFMTAREIQVTYGTHRELIGGGWLNLSPGEVTDDTEMSLFLARSIVEQGHWSLTCAAKHLALWLKSRPKDIGNTVLRGLRAYVTHGRLEVPPGPGDAGNGAAMRLLPVALCTLGDPELSERCMLEQAHLTHNHALSDAACLSVTRLVQAAVCGRSLSHLRREASELVASIPVFTYSPYPGQS